MRGKPQFNFPAFMDADRILTKAGWDTVNPADHDLEMGFNPVYMKGTEDELGDFDMLVAAAWDLEMIVRECDAIAMLPGWKTSGGAKAEFTVARWLCLDTYTFDRTTPGGLQPLLGKVTLDV